MNKTEAGSREAVLAQHHRRFDELYREFHDPVFGYVLRRTESSDDAADVIAETFLIAWRRLDDIPAGAQSRLWLYGVARRVLANYRRGERRRSSLADRLRGELANTHSRPESTGELAELAAAFRRLSDEDREVLALEGWEGLDRGQIAVVLGCSRNAVRIRLHRARRRLAQQLAGRAPAGPPPSPNPVYGEAT
jgi:RNA polymerase sigma-70 factor (ECF subfamily)